MAEVSPEVRLFLDQLNQVYRSAPFSPSAQRAREKQIIGYKEQIRRRGFEVHEDPALGLWKLGPNPRGRPDES